MRIIWVPRGRHAGISPSPRSGSPPSFSSSLSLSMWVPKGGGEGWGAIANFWDTPPPPLQLPLLALMQMYKCTYTNDAFTRSLLPSNRGHCASSNCASRHVFEPMASQSQPGSSPWVSSHVSRVFDEGRTEINVFVKLSEWLPNFLTCDL